MTRIETAKTRVTSPTTEGLRLETVFVRLSEVGNLSPSKQRAALVEKTCAGDENAMVENFKQGLIKRVNRYTEGDENYSRDIDEPLRNEFLALSENMQERLRHFGRAAVAEGKVSDELYALVARRKEAGRFAIELARLERNPVAFFNRASGIELVRSASQERRISGIKVRVGEIMHSKQKIVLFLGALVIVLLGLFPPWREKADIPYKVHFQKALGYQFIGSPPTSTLLSIPEFSYYKDATTIQVDLSRLFIGWVIVGAITAALFFMLRSQTEIK